MLSYAKGEMYFAGQRSGELKGRTGIWLLSTDKTIASNNLSDHLEYLIALLQLRRDGSSDGTRLTHNLIRLKKLMKEYELTASVSCFWYGSAGAHPPSMPRHYVEAFSLIDAEIETDFDTDESPIGGHAMAV